MSNFPIHEVSKPGGLERELTCAICLELYNNPISLPCHHVFCRDCLADRVLMGPTTRSKKSRLGFECPHCRNHVWVEKTGVDCLPKNFILANVVEKFKEAQLALQLSQVRIKPTSDIKESQAAPESLVDAGDGANGDTSDAMMWESKHCSVCERSPPLPAVKVCINCNLLAFCKHCCAQFHPLRGEKSKHEMIDVSTLNTPEMQCSGEPVEGQEGQQSIAEDELCNKHRKLLTLYCVPCRELICFQCAGMHTTNRHESHEVVSADKVYKKELTSVQNEQLVWLHEAHKALVDLSQHQELEGKKIPDEWRKKRRFAMKEFQRLRSLLDMKEGAVFSELQSKTNELLKSHHQKSGYLWKTRGETEQLLSDIENLINEKKSDFFQKLESVTQRIPEKSSIPGPTTYTPVTATPIANSTLDTEQAEAAIQNINLTWPTTENVDSSPSLARVEYNSSTPEASADEVLQATHFTEELSSNTMDISNVGCKSDTTATVKLQIQENTKISDDMNAQTNFTNTDISQPQSLNATASVVRSTSLASLTPEAGDAESEYSQNRDHSHSQCVYHKQELATLGSNAAVGDESTYPLYQYFFWQHIPCNRQGATKALTDTVVGTKNQYMILCHILALAKEKEQLIHAVRTCILNVHMGRNAFVDFNFARQGRPKSRALFTVLTDRPFQADDPDLVVWKYNVHKQLIDNLIPEFLVKTVVIPPIARQRIKQKLQNISYFTLGLLTSHLDNECASMLHTVGKKAHVEAILPVLGSLETNLELQLVNAEFTLLPHPSRYRDDIHRFIDQFAIANPDIIVTSDSELTKLRFSGPIKKLPLFREKVDSFITDIYESAVAYVKNIPNSIYKYLIMPQNNLSQLIETKLNEANVVCSWITDPPHTADCYRTTGTTNNNVKIYASSAENAEVASRIFHECFKMKIKK